MPELAFDRTIINNRERPLSQDQNSAQAQLDRSLREVLAAMLARRTSVANDVAVSPTGFFGDGFKVRANSPASMVVDVTAGIGLMPNADRTSDLDGILGLDDQASSSPIYLSATQEFTVPTAPTVGNARWDIIMVKATPEVGDPTSRDIMNGSGVFAAQLVNKTLKFDVLGEVETIAAATAATAALVYKYGVSAVAGSEVEPATDAGYVKIAGIRVGASVTSIEANKIIDNRRFLAPDGALKASMFATWSAGPGAMPATFGLIAPAGLEGTIVRTSAGVSNTFTAYLKAGGADAADAMHVLVSGAGEDAGGIVARLWQGTLDTVVADSALQTLLAGAASSNPLQVAVGQRVYRFAFYFRDEAAGGATVLVSALTTAINAAKMTAQFTILPQ